MINNDMVSVQNKILEIALYMDEFCKKHNITYYLMGGSALGAVRHDGFIPWDDDLDVFMTFDNYTKFILACENDLDDKQFYLQKENTKEWPLFFTKLRMNNTTFIEEDTKDKPMHKGFYIDIMCLNNTTKNVFIRYLQYSAARIIVILSLAERGYSTENRIKKIVIGLASKILFIKKPIVSVLLKFVRFLNKSNTGYVGHFFGRAKFTNTSFPKNYLGRQRYTKFSDATLPVPEKVEEYLGLRYGEKFMEMPDQRTKDLYPSHAIFVDLNKDYTYYEK